MRRGTGRPPDEQRVRPDTARSTSGGVRPDQPRSGHQNEGRQRQVNTRIIPPRPKFEGRTEGLKGHVYDLRPTQADQFVKTTKEVALYVGRTYTNGSVIKAAIETLEPPLIQPPEELPEDATRTETRIWEERIKDFVKRETIMKENIKALYSLVWGQCSDPMQAKLESLPGFQDVFDRSDGIDLIRLIKNVSFNFESQKYLPHAIHEAKRRFFACSQGRTATCQEYLEKFQNLLSVLEAVGAVIGPDTSVANALAGGGANVTQRHLDAAGDRALAVAFLLGADKVRYGRLIEDLENSHLQGSYG